MIRAAVVSFAAIALAGCDIGNLGPGDRYKSDFHYSYDLQPGGRIDVETFNGAIEISGWDQGRVEIDGSKYGATEELRDAVKINVSPQPDSITVRAVRPPDLRGSMGARFTIHAPKNAVIGRIMTSNGAVRVADLAADGQMRTSNGSIHVENLRGNLNATTSNGSIEASSVRGDATLRTSNGRISAESIAGRMEAETTNGAIQAHVENAPAVPMKFETSNGPINVTLGQPPRADLRAATSNSSIAVHLPENTSARVVAVTSNGAVSSDFDLTGRVSMSKHHVEGAIGNGGPSITLTTSNGPIRILKTPAR